VLSDFNGVLVSDFYSAYDALPCAQQRCLIHILRDINDDLARNPFDSELRHMATEFGRLLSSIIIAINRFGLKKRHLQKFKKKAVSFLREMSQQVFHSDVAAAYQRRFNRNDIRLFTFLDHDGVPWNNNNAEHAIKAFVRLRKVIGSSGSSDGIGDYLKLLTISETCACNEVNFLSFLRSGEKDLTAYAGRHRRGTPRSITA